MPLDLIIAPFAGFTGQLQSPSIVRILDGSSTDNAWSGRTIVCTTAGVLAANSTVTGIRVPGVNGQINTIPAAPGSLFTSYIFNIL